MRSLVAAQLFTFAAAQTWTPWLNRDQPGGSSDYEFRGQVELELQMASPFLNSNSLLITSINNGGLSGNVPIAAGQNLCHILGAIPSTWQPVATECRVISTQQDFSLTGQTFQHPCLPSTGFTCNNVGQTCLDYEVRYLCDNPASVLGDPHFRAFGGGSFDVMGEADKIYNIISHPDLQINGRFVVGETAHNTTFLGEIGVQYKGEMIHLNPGACTADVVEPEVHLPRGFGAFSTDNGLRMDVYGKGIFLDAAAFTLDLQCVNKRQSQHFNLAASFRGEPEEGIAAHGLLGQTADLRSREGMSVQGAKQGEGVIEGVYTDYEVDTLFSNDFRFNRYTS